MAQGHITSNPNKCFDGNRPNCIILGKKLDPYTLGALLALYEHKVQNGNAKRKIEREKRWLDGRDGGREVGRRYRGWSEGSEQLREEERILN